MSLVQNTENKNNDLLVQHLQQEPGTKKNIPPDILSPPFYLPLKNLNSRYKTVSKLGNGSFGTVCLAKSVNDLYDSTKFKIFKSTLLQRNKDFNHENYLNKQTGVVAIKTMTKKLQCLNDYTKIKEVRFILSIPYHQNLVQVYEMFIDDSQFQLHIVMECMDQNLYQLMKSRKRSLFSLPTLKSILSQILNGIRHIHRCDYFHRDIKPENILVTPSTSYYDQNFLINSKFQHNFIIKIADYGLARHIKNKRPYTSYVSTRWYRAPEILLRKNWYSRPVDIWAFGSVAAEVATFKPLFPGADEIGQTYKVLDFLGTPSSRNCFQNNYHPSYGYWDEATFLSAQLGLQIPQKKCIDISNIINQPELSPLCDVIRACLTWNPETRINVEQICSMPYFKNTCVDDYAVNDYDNLSDYLINENENENSISNVNQLQNQSEIVNGVKSNINYSIKNYKGKSLNNIKREHVKQSAYNDSLLSNENSYTHITKPLSIIDQDANYNNNSNLSQQNYHIKQLLQQHPQLVDDSSYMYPLDEELNSLEDSATNIDNHHLNSYNDYLYNGYEDSNSEDSLLNIGVIPDCSNNMVSTSDMLDEYEEEDDGDDDAAENDEIEVQEDSASNNGNYASSYSTPIEKEYAGGCQVQFDSTPGMAGLSNDIYPNISQYKRSRNNQS